MLANLYLAYTDCSDVVKHIRIDIAKMFGFDEKLLEQCEEVQSRIEKEVVMVPRKITMVSSDSINECLANTKDNLVGCIPIDTGSARRLAKVGKVLTIILTPKNHKFVNESQINFMIHSTTPKYIEIHLYPFVTHMLNINSNVDAEKEFYEIGNIIEYAIKKDVGVIPSAASPNIKKTLLVTHMNIILQTMGFSKRERRLMLEFYPMEVLQNWLSQ